MPDDLRRRAEVVFQKASDLPIEAREEFVERACADDPALRGSVRRLLDAADHLGDFLDCASDDPAERALSGDENHPAKIGHYDIVRVVGNGGMGVVYEARQHHTRRRVALKVIHPSFVSGTWLKRFEQEAEILGRLHHPGVATIYEAGRETVEGMGRAPVELPFLAMEFVEGVPLDEYARQRSIDGRERLGLVARVCDAVQHAHEHGIVHRDLKPSNILVDLDGQPKVIDFGIARVGGADWKALSVPTASHQLLGTVAYMSPEQVGGGPGEVDARSDVYSLGVILYELLCGRLPIDTHRYSLPEAIRAIREDEPSRPGSVDPTLRGDIDAIVGKALRKEKDRRYATARAMSEDIRRHLRNEPIVARPTGTIYQLRRFARRNKVLVGGVAATIAALALGLVASIILARREADQRRRAEAMAAQVLREAYMARFATAIASLNALDPATAARSLDDVPEQLRLWAWKHLRWRAGMDLAEVPRPEGGRRSVALARRASLLFFADGSSETGGDGLVRIWNLETAREVGRLATGARFIGSMASDAGGGLLLADTSSGTLRRKEDGNGRHLVLWDARSGRELWRRPGAFTLGRDAFSPDASLVAVGPWSGYAILLLDARTGTTLETIRVPDETAQTPDFSPDGAWLMYRNTGSAWVANRATGRSIRLNTESRDRFEHGGFADDGRTVIGTHGSELILMDLETGGRHVVPGFTLSSDPPERIVAWPGDSASEFAAKRLLISEASGTTVRRLGGGSIAAFLGARGRPLGWSHSGRRVATMDEGGILRIWDSATDARPLTIPAPPKRTNDVFALSRDGRLFATGGWGFVTLYELDTGRERWHEYALEPSIGALTFDPTGGWLAVAAPRGDTALLADGRRRAAPDQEGEITLLDVGSGAVDRRLSAPPGNAVGMAWTDDGKAILIATREGRLRLLDAGSGDPLLEMGREDESYGCLALGAHGSLVAAGGRFPARRGSDEQVAGYPGVAVWDVRTGKRRGVFDLEHGAVEAVAFDALGERLTAVTSAGETAVWDLRRGERLGGETHEHLLPGAVAFSPSGRRVVAAGRDGTLSFEDPAGRLNDLFLGSGLSDVSSLTFTPDGRTLVAGGPKGFVLLETGPPPGGFEARSRIREARRVLDELYAEVGLSEEVTRRLLADAKLPGDVRLAALEMARSRGDHLGWLQSDAITSYRTTTLSAPERRFALRKIELANRLRPDHPEFVATLGICQHRAGLYREALETLARARKLHRASGKELPIEARAFVTMAHQRQGETDAARRAMRDLESRLAEHPEEADVRVLGSIEEARAAVGRARRPAAGEF